MTTLPLAATIPIGSTAACCARLGATSCLHSESVEDLISAARKLRRNVVRKSPHGWKRLSRPQLRRTSANGGSAMRSLVAGFGWLFGLGVVALVARYGYISSDNQVNGAILAFLFAGVAAGGLFGHAVAVHIWRIHRGWSFVLGLICVAALVLIISNSLGAIAGRDHKTLAERTK